MHYSQSFLRPAIRYVACLSLILSCSVAKTVQAQDSHQHHKKTEHHTQHQQTAKPNELLQMARQLQDQADMLEQGASNVIQSANKLRKRVKQFRSEQRKISDPATLATYKSMTDELAVQLERYQGISAQSRESASAVRETANGLFRRAFQQQWADWISNGGDLVLESGDHDTMAHNNQVRSAHPNMKELIPDTSEMPEKHEGMSMRVPAMESQPATDDLNTSTFQLSRDRNYIAHIEVEPGPDNQAKSVPLNEIHRWRLILSDLDGAAIEGADIEIVGHMPGHVHGLPTQPIVTDEIAPGVYRIEGMKFQMQGWWVMEFNIMDDMADTVKFDILL